MILEALERVIRNTMYADAYEEAVRDYLLARAWLNFKPVPGETITVSRPKAPNNER